MNAVGAHKAYKGPLIIVDSGTATTFDVISAEGDFEGGVISPGINLSLRALHEAAAKLPSDCHKKARTGDRARYGRGDAIWYFLGLYWIDRRVDNADAPRR